MDLSKRLSNLSDDKKKLLVQKILAIDPVGLKSRGSVKTQRLVAYVVADDLLPPTADELKDLLVKTLPEFMVPQSFVFIDEIPLSPNGKVNINALSEQNSNTSGDKKNYTEAKNSIEEKLVAIWSSVLGMNLIGIHDNFFEIGGDSILSIQIIARSKKEGIYITPKQIFQNLTISELATVAQTESIAKAEQGLISGHVPLTPIQHWLLERDLPNINHWNQAAMFEMPKNIDSDLLKLAMSSLIKHHDILRSCFIYKNNEWSQHINKESETINIVEYDLRDIPVDQIDSVINEKSNKVQSSLNIEESKVFSLCIFKMPENTFSDRLFFVIHHLVVDAVSWMTITEDLETIYKQLQKIEVIKLPDKTSSYKEWSNSLLKYSTSNELESEIEFWLSMPTSGVFDIPVDIENGDNNEMSEKKYAVSLSAEETNALLKDVPHVYNTKIDDILLAALVQVITEWTGLSTMTLGMEGHGREQLNDELDLSRSVGWYTSYFPVALKNSNKDPANIIKSIKEQLRRIPNKGIGYAILRYLRKDQMLTEKLTSIHKANILYNYLGQFSNNENDNSLFKVVDDASNHHDLTGTRSHLIEIDAMIFDNKLKLDWVYSENIHFETTIKQLADNFITSLRELILHCQSPEAGGFSASDFPEANLAEDELDDLLGMLDD